MGLGGGPFFPRRPSVILTFIKASFLDAFLRGNTLTVPAIMMSSQIVTVSDNTRGITRPVSMLADYDDVPLLATAVRFVARRHAVFK